MPDGLPVAAPPHVFHRQPLAHQREIFDRFKDAPYFALFWEQRCGKSKAVLDIFQYRYERGDVEALIVIAFPNGVHRVLIDELEKDFSPELLSRTRAVAWAGGRSTNKTNAPYWRELRDYRAGPVIATFNCESIIGESKAAKWIEWFVTKRRVMLVADEASWMANHSKRTQRMLAFGRRPNVIVKAILDGTPSEEGPSELYYPCEFLKRDLLGFSTPVAFRARYFEYEEEEVPELAPRLDATGRPRYDELTGEALMVPTGRVIRQRVKRQRHSGGRVVGEYEIFKGYRNLDELERKVKAFGSRVRRADVSDAPSKLYQTRYFELTTIQRKVYDELRDKYIAQLNDGSTIRAANVLLRMTRLQMVTRGYHPPERDGEVCPTCAGEGALLGAECEACDGIGIRIVETGLRRIDPSRNPALEALRDELRTSREPVIIWCRFRQDVLDCLTLTRELGMSFWRYDGGLPEAQREEGYQRFRAGEGDGIVGTISSGLQRGKDLSRAGSLIYYSNDFSLRSRRQSEDRAEGLSRATSTGVIDLLATDTRDLTIIEALRAKRSIAERIMGDPPETWI